METKHKFVFGTIVCDGCACRIDSRDYECEILRDIEDMLDYWLVSKGWKEYKDGKWYCKECAKDPSHRTHPNEGRIIREKEILYGLRCDHCGSEFEDFEGRSCFNEISGTIEKAIENDWEECGDKVLCPDCWEECKAIQAEDDGKDGEIYCVECPCKADCNETAIRDIPKPSFECTISVPENEGRDKMKCPYYEQHGNLAAKCTLPTKAACPRLTKWAEIKERVEKGNEEVERWATGK